MKNLSASSENVIISETSVFENVITIERLEERLETLETCELIMQ